MPTDPPRFLCLGSRLSIGLLIGVAVFSVSLVVHVVRVIRVLAPLGVLGMRVLRSGG